VVDQIRAALRPAVETLCRTREMVLMVQMKPKGEGEVQTDEFICVVKNTKMGILEKLLEIV
jgi:hypothetical protein